MHYRIGKGLGEEENVEHLVGVNFFCQILTYERVRYYDVMLSFIKALRDSSLFIKFKFLRNKQNKPNWNIFVNNNLSILKRFKNKFCPVHISQELGTLARLWFCRRKRTSVGRVSLERGEVQINKGTHVMRSSQITESHK